MSVLALEDVSKRYAGAADTVVAAERVTLTVRAGELVGVYGPSGSGKTTLLLLAAALSEPDSGRVCFDGRDVHRLSAKEGAQYRLRDVGFVFQAFHLMPHASALDNATLKLTGAGHTLREAREQVRPWLDRVGLAARAGHTPEQLSMGERQRVAIARALAGEPRLLLADEPTGNLDSVRSAEIFELLAQISHERSIPALLVTHDVAAMRFVDRAHTLRDGRLSEGVAPDLLAAAR